VTWLGKSLPWFAAPLLLLSVMPAAQAEQGRVDNIKEAFERFRTCWKPPPASKANPDVEITAIVTFRRDGSILGHPKITYESENATDNDRLLYRIAVMDALQRCTPMPFTDAMGGAVAGRPFAIRFQVRKPPPKPIENRACLTTTIL
jgi:hypothetical protein